MPHALRRVGPDEQTATALGVLAGYDADLAAEATRLTNRLHDALLHVHPALERLLGQHFRRGGVLELLAAAGAPAQLRELREDGLRQVLAARSQRLAVTLPAQILAALDEQLRSPGKYPHSLITPARRNPRTRRSTLRSATR